MLHNYQYIAILILIEMPCCAVSTCNSQYRKTYGQKISYYTFPKDPKVSKLWLTKCKRGDKVNVKNARICSRHFTPEDFAINLQNELLKIPYIKSLKRDAVPSLFLQPEKNTVTPGTITTESNSSAPPVNVSTPKDSSEVENQYITVSMCDSGVSDRDARLKAREIRQRALQHIKELPPKEPVKTHDDKECSASFDNITMINLKMKLAQMEAKCRNLQEANTKLTAEAITQRKHADSLSINLMKVNAENKSLKLREERRVNSILKQKVTSILKPIFSTGQIRSLLNNGRRVKWSSEDIVSALSLKSSVSCGVYNHLRRSGFPLPGKRTLQRWTKEVGSEPENQGSEPVPVENLTDVSGPWGHEEELATAIEQVASQL